MSLRSRTTVASLRRRSFATIAVVAMMGFSLMAVGSASASPALQLSEGGNGTYLALGDSVAFGYIPPQAIPTPNYSDASNFTSYANDVAQSLGLSLTNASCPGETTSSMIDLTALSNGCENAPGSPYGYRSAYPLHVSYSGSQLDYAVSFLKAHPHTRLVTIDIGANDAFVCQELLNGCTNPSDFSNVLAAIATNLATIYHAIRVEAHYTHALVALDYYSLSYNDSTSYGLTQEGLTQALNQAITVPTLAFGGIVADGYGAFEAASASSDGDPCAAGLLVELPGGGCNIHPSLLGHQVLAGAILAALSTHPSKEPIGLEKKFVARGDALAPYSAHAGR